MVVVAVVYCNFDELAKVQFEEVKIHDLSIAQNRSKTPQVQSNQPYLYTMTNTP